MWQRYQQKKNSLKKFFFFCFLFLCHSSDQIRTLPEGIEAAKNGTYKIL